MTYDNTDTRDSNVSSNSIHHKSTRTKKIVIFTIMTIGIVTLLYTSYESTIHNREELEHTLLVDATYVPEERVVTITYSDLSGEQADHIAVEVLGMLPESYRKVFSNVSSFKETIIFSEVPTYGWKTNPVILDITHTNFGNIQIKTEIHHIGDPAPRVIYGSPP